MLAYAFVYRLMIDERILSPLAAKFCISMAAGGCIMIDYGVSIRQHGFRAFAIQCLAGLMIFGVLLVIQSLVLD